MRSYDKPDSGRTQTFNTIAVGPIYFKTISAVLKISIHASWFPAASGIPVLLISLQAVTVCGESRIAVVE